MEVVSDFVPMEEGYGRYEINSLGIVRNIARGNELIPQPTGSLRKQYPAVFLPTDKGFRGFKLHILVAKYFIGPRPDGMLVCHKDDDQWNCSKDNLYYGTPSQNVRDRVRIGNSAQQKLTMEQVSEIKARRTAGEKGAALAMEYGVSQQTICDAFKGRKLQ